MKTDQTAFRQACIQRIEEVFCRHHLEAPTFIRGEESSGWYWATVSADESDPDRGAA